MSDAAAFDWYVTPEAFEAAHPYLLVAAKQNYDTAGNLAGPLPLELVPSKLTAEWPNAIDNFVLDWQRNFARFMRWADGPPATVSPLGAQHTDTLTGIVYTNRTGLAAGWVPLEAQVNALAYGASTSASAAANATAINAAIRAATEAGGGTLVLPPGDYACNNLEIQDAADLTITGGGRLVWSAASSGLQLIGLCSRVTIRGLRFLGSGVAADGHRGVYSLSGQTLVGVVVEHCEIVDCMVGISFNADLSGSIRSCVARFNIITNVVGESSGQGYGIHVADGTSLHHGTLVYSNRITQAHRHSIYVARGYGCRVFGNTVDLHRDGDSTGSTLGAIMVARGGDHTIEANLITRANNVGVFLDSGSTGGEFLRNVSVVGNTFAAPVGIHPHLYVGEDVTPDGDISGITIVANTFDSGAGWNIPALRVNWGHGVTIADNVVRMRGVTAATYGIHLVARGESAMSATSSSRWLVRGNFVRIEDGGGGSASAGIRLVSPFVDVSTVDLRCDGNEFIVPGNAFSASANVANPNVTVAMQPITGLTYAAGVAQLGHNAVASAMQILGNLTLTGTASVIQVGDATVAGNAQMLRVKGDANAQTSDRWNNAGALSWGIQHDASENLNWLDSAAAVIGGWQRTGSYWRSAAGFRLGSTTGPLQVTGAGSPENVLAAPVGSTYQRTDGGAATSFYVKESGTGTTGWVGK